MVSVHDMGIDQITVDSRDQVTGRRGGASPRVIGSWRSIQRGGGGHIIELA
jgi:hypothetical protein